MKSAVIRVPATTANFACGFDTLGCALSLYNTVSFTPAGVLSFTGCDAEFCNSENLAWRGFRAVYDSIGRDAPAVHIDIRADIPVSRGLGSSAAMLAAGACAANVISGAELTRRELLTVLTPIEGHPDNLAPALFGGMTASLYEGGRVYTSSLPLCPELHFVALSPDYPLSTHKARSVLPAAVAFPAAVYDLPRLALLPEALAVGDEELLALCLSDMLHQPYRAALIPGMEDIRAIAAENGCRAMCISGAGSSLLCLSRDAGFAARLEADVAALPHGWQVRDLRADTDGAREVTE